VAVAVVLEQAQVELPQMVVVLEGMPAALQGQQTLEVAAVAVGLELPELAAQV